MSDVDKIVREAMIKKVMTRMRVNINRILNQDPEKPTVGFVLIVYPFDEKGECFYTSNTLRREDVIVLLKEQLAQLEGRAPSQEGHG